MRRFVLILALVVLLPAAAAADTFTINVSPTAGLNLTDVGIMTSTRTFNAGSIYVGQDTIYNAVTRTVLFPIAYCVDLLEWAANGVVADTRPLSELPEAGDPPGVNADAGGRIAWLLNTFAFGATTAVQAAALQLAIWEVEYETLGTFSLTGGTTRALGTSANALSAMNLANTYLAALGTNTSEGIWLDVRSTNQDFGIPVPEPGVMLLFGTGLICVAAFSRRISRRRS